MSASKRFKQVRRIVIDLTELRKQQQSACREEFISESKAVTLELLSASELAAPGLKKVGVSKDLETGLLVEQIFIHEAGGH